MNKINRAILLLPFIVALFLNPACQKEEVTDPTENEKDWIFLANYIFKVTDVVYFGETSYGIRVDLYFEGPFTGDSINGRMVGIDYYTIRENEPDLINAYASIYTNDSALITAHITGLIYDDGTIQDETVVFESGYPRYTWLNNHEFTGNGETLPDTSYSVNYYYNKN